MELGHLPFKKATFEDYVGSAVAHDSARRNGRRPSPRRSTG